MVMDAEIKPISEGKKTNIFPSIMKIDLANFDAAFYDPVCLYYLYTTRKGVLCGNPPFQNESSDDGA